MSTKDPPELSIQFWRFKVSARGREAILAIRKPLRLVLLALALRSLLLTGALGVLFAFYQLNFFSSLRSYLIGQ